jgi:hypothetical protein
MLDRMKSRLACERRRERSFELAEVVFTGGVEKRAKPSLRNIVMPSLLTGAEPVSLSQVRGLSRAEIIRVGRSSDAGRNDQEAVAASFD